MPALILALTLGAFGAPTMPKQPTNRLIPIIERLRLDRNELREFYDLESDPDCMARLDRFYVEEEKKIAGFGGTQNVEEAIDLLLTRNFLDYQRKSLFFIRKKVEETDEFLPFARDLLNLEADRRATKAIDPRRAADQLVEIEKIAKAAKDRVQKLLDSKQKLPSPVIADRTSKRLDRLAQVLDFWFRQYDGFHPLFSWWVKKPQESLIGTLKDYSKLLKEKIAGYREGEDAPLIGDPIGRDALLADMKAEMLDYSPEDLLAMAEKEFAWCESEAKKAAAEMGLGSDWKKAMDKVKSLHVEPGQQDQLVASQAREAIKFVEDRKLVTIESLCKETWRLEMLGQETQKSLPFAVYLGQRMGVSFPLSTQDHETKEMSLRGNNEHFTRAITHHELIPGHHLQGYMAERYNSHRRLFSTPFLVEGWALYWEMLLWDQGFARGPEDRLGMLFWRMHRSARITVSLKFHLGEMSPTEMISFLVDRVAHEKFTATSEVRRFIGGDYSPLYQCAYMIGGLQLRALEQELVTSGKMSHRQFHDAILHSGPIPIKMIGQRLRSL